MKTASQNLKNLLCDCLKHKDIKTDKLIEIKKALWTDLEIIDILINANVEIVLTEETEERDMYYSIRKNGVEISDQNRREHAIETVCKYHLDNEIKPSLLLLNVTK